MRLLNELNKQFRTVSEKTDFIDKDEAEMNFQDLPDQDIDNDGDTDASDKYLHKRLGTIAKIDENELGVKEPYYVEVSVRDAREVADILQDIGILKQLTRYGSNVYATKNEAVFQELMQAITDNEIELYSSSIDEMSTTAAVPGYQTPYAFGDADDDTYTQAGMELSKMMESKSSFKRMMAEMYGIKSIKEAVSYNEYKKDPNASPQQKVNKGIAEINGMLAEIEHMVQNNVRLKQEMGVNSSHFWKATGKRFAKINERMTRISNRLRELSK
jgi:hypothetical protein